MSTATCRRCCSTRPSDSPSANTTHNKMSRAEVDDDGGDAVDVWGVAAPPAAAGPLEALARGRIRLRNIVCYVFSYIQEK